MSACALCTKAFTAKFDHWPSLTDEAMAEGWKLTVTKDARYAALVAANPSFGIRIKMRFHRWMVIVVRATWCATG